MVSKVPPPPIPPEDLVAIRDGEKPSMDRTNVLADSMPAQRELLESRLFSLALSLAEGKPSTETRLDADELLDYVSGEMSPEGALKLERRIRGDRQAFARLIETKEAFFGQDRALAKIRQRPRPQFEREIIGTLVIQVNGPNTQLRSQRTRDPERRLLVADVAAAAERASPPSANIEQSDVAAALEQISSLHSEIQDITAELRQFTKVLSFRNDPKMAMMVMDMVRKLTDRTRMLSELTQRLQQRTMQVMQRASDPVAFFDEDERPLPSAITWETDTAELEFKAGHRKPGELALTIRPIEGRSPQATFTWVVRGVDFKQLKPGTKAHELGRVANGALLLIDPGFGPTQVLRVEED
jgi:hypothetical protein